MWGTTAALANSGYRKRLPNCWQFVRPWVKYLQTLGVVRHFAV